MSISLSAFGKAADGRVATLYTLINKSSAYITLCDFGARVVSIYVPDRDGKLADVNIGFDEVAPYIAHGGPSIGASIGRVGNRIGGAKFTLNGTEYKVPMNDGVNSLHGGEGFHTRWWQAECHEREECDLVTFRYESADGEEGYPGKMLVEVTYAWTEKNEMCIHYHAVSDKDTLCNLTNHAYFNLSDEDSVLDHTLQINASLITATDEALIPTGEELDVTGLPVDFRKPLRIRDGMARAAEYPLMVVKNGYDFNFRVDGQGMRVHAILRSPASGRVMHVCSTEPCIQLYTGQHFNTTGHGGRHYPCMAGLALETQHHPDAIHHANFPSVVLRAGEEFVSDTVYSFGVE